MSRHRAAVSKPRQRHAQRERRDIHDVDITVINDSHALAMAIQDAEVLGIHQDVQPRHNVPPVLV